MTNSEIVFVTLCYKNTTDIVDFLENLKKSNLDYSVVIVNSFYDTISESIIYDIAKRYGCSFISVENKGYGYGNNVGIEYVTQNICFKHLCVCNPDILFFNANSLRLLSGSTGIVAPRIETATGKLQNPYYAINSRMVRTLKRLACIHSNKFFFYCAVAINKLSNLVYKLLISKYNQRIYACHGSCFFVDAESLMVLRPLFNEMMFLFNEEEHVARKAKCCEIPIIFNKQIKVYHKEDGSSDDIVRDNKEFELLCKSYVELDSFWRKK